MELKDWLLPVLSLALAAIPLGNAIRQKKRIALLLLALLAASTSAAVWYNTRDSQQAKMQQEQADTRINGLIKISEKTANNTDWIKDQLAQHGNLKALQLIDTSFQADSERTKLAGAVASTAASVHVVYYPKQVEDSAKVQAALEKAGFHVELQKPRLADVKTGVVWAGDDVSPDVAKFIALTMLRAGVEIKAVRRFANGSGPKAHLVEIGGDATLASAPPLTVDAITSITQLERQPKIEYGN